MSAIKGRRQRHTNAPTVLLQARVDPDVRAKAHRTAAAMGVSLTAYLELLVQHEQLDEHDRPLWWTEAPLPEQEALPLTRSA